MEEFVNHIPKAELHVHIEGTLEPELMFRLAKRNKIKLPHQTIEQVKAAYEFTNLQSFLDIYYAACNVLQTEQDFYDLAFSYLTRAHADCVRHAEIFFDPQTHTERGVDIGVILQGLYQATVSAQKEYGISSKLILSFLRDLSADQALITLNSALPYRDFFVAVGLDSAEANHPPRKFVEVYAKARSEGLLAVAHAGEEGPAEYIWEALDKLKVVRIDHGVRCVEDIKLMEHLREQRIPLTVCPLSNIKLQVFPGIDQHPLKDMLEHDLCVTINSDDPAYFEGYVNHNYLAVINNCNFDRKTVVKLAKNSFEASFLTPQEKQEYLADIDRYDSPA